MINSILVPDFLSSDTQYSRYYHQDLCDMQTESLLDELWAIRSRLWFVKSERYRAMVGRFEQCRIAGWLQERKSRIETELRKRGYVAQGSRNQPKPKLAEGVINKVNEMVEGKQRVKKPGYQGLKVGGNGS